MPADYQVIDASGAMVWRTLPYSRLFVPTQSGSPVLLLWVKTGYTSPLSAASIRINGTEISKISPRPWTDHNILNLEAVAVPFSSSVLVFGPFGLPLPNTLTIVPQSGDFDYVFVDDVILMTRS